MKLSDVLSSRQTDKFQRWHPDPRDIDHSSYINYTLADTPAFREFLRQAVPEELTGRDRETWEEIAANLIGDAGQYDLAFLTRNARTEEAYRAILFGPFFELVKRQLNDPEVRQSIADRLAFYQSPKFREITLQWPEWPRRREELKLHAPPLVWKGVPGVQRDKFDPRAELKGEHYAV